MTDACSHRCGGACCRRFPISASPARMAALYATALTARAAGDDSQFVHDTIMIAEMLIPLAEESDEQPTYTCRHLDDASGLCMAYDQRPAMCRDYPSYGVPGRACDGCGFTQTPAESELVQLKAAS